MRKSRSSTTSLVVAIGLVVGLLATPGVRFEGRAAADTLEIAAGPSRYSWYQDQPELAPSTINDHDFGQLFSTTLDGQVYAQPLVSQGTLLAVTENNSAYGIDPVSGTVHWQHNYGTAFSPSVLSCGDLSPKIGITATPVIDPATNIGYFTSKVATAADSSSSAWYMHAVNVATGVEQAGFPVLIHGTATNDPGTTFNAQFEMQRTGLTIVNGVVYAGFGGHCDYPPYLGWVIGVSTAGNITSLWANQTGQSSGGGAGIWQAGAGPVVDATGHLFYVSGNGTTPGDGPAIGQPQPQGLGECVTKLNTTTNGIVGRLSVADWFCPADAEQLNAYDGDFGSGGPAALPPSFQSPQSNFPMMVTAGKDGVLYLLNMNDLGGVAQGPGGTDKVVAEVGPYGGVWSKPAVWGGDGGYVYLPTASPGAAGAGSSGQLNVFRRVVDGSGQVGLSLVAHASSAFGFSSSSPVVTSDGTTSGSSVVWIVHADDASGVGATLQAYQAVPQAGVLPQLWSAPLGTPGTSAKFNPPAIDNGRVYVGTRDGTVVAFGAVDGAPSLRANLVSFPSTSLGASTTASATFTATASITINSIGVQNATSSQTPVFAAGTTTPALPVTLNAGEDLTVPLTFTPAALGLQTGTLTANTDAGAVNLPLDGDGVASTVPITATPPSVDFGTRAVGDPPSNTTITFTNTGGSTFTITGLEAPVGPFTVTNAPATDGTVTVAPGGSIGIGVRYTPPSTSGAFVQTFTGQLRLITDVGTALVPVQGSAAPPAQISISPASIDFGSVALGHTETRSFTVGNAGGTPLTILKSKPPVANQFRATSTLAEGTVIQPHQHVTETVRFTPTARGVRTDGWVINGNDDTGVQTVRFTATGARYATVPPPSAGGWTLNGSATRSGGTVQLTPALQLQAGSAFWPHALSSKSMSVSFVSTIGGGGGADGLTLAFADAATARPTALGENGSRLGFGGIPGVAVGLATYPSATNTSANSIGLVNGVTAAGLQWKTIATAIPQLRTGTHLIAVKVRNGRLTVFVDGFATFNLAVTLPPKVYLGFTGGTGGITDVHSVSQIQIAWGSPILPPPPAPPPPPVVPPSGYRLVASDGGIFTYGSARFYGSTGGMHLNAPIVGIATDPKTGGYWMVASDGGVFAFHAPFLGSMGATHLNAPIVGIAATRDGGGYWMVASDGGIFTFGNARFHGSTGALHLNAPIVGMAADPATGGYWLVASDGGIFTFGAPYLGSAGARPLRAPVAGMVAMPDGRGYRLVGTDGAVLPFGTAASYGSAVGRLGSGRVAGIAVTHDGRGYWQVANGGAVYAFGDARYFGAANGQPLKAPIVGISAS
ncbi:MAG TPA: choice-of-anchor D domain-containing protein [Acidimicrobiia bacterium]|nr:choice-of-anchor D domain-containing protein [Acidimicrobiia bacterium]